MQRFLSAALATALSIAPAVAPAQSKETAPVPPDDMTTYYLVFLVKGDTPAPADAADRQKLQDSHIGHMRALHEAGKLVIAGPLLDNQPLRGICVYKTASAEEARTLAEGDPAVKSGRLKVEVHPWMVQKGILP